MSEAGTNASPYIKDMIVSFSKKRLMGNLIFLHTFYKSGFKALTSEWIEGWMQWMNGYNGCLNAQCRRPGKQIIKHFYKGETKY